MPGWKVIYLPEAEDERSRLPPTEVSAIINAVEKLKAMGPTLGHPHTSAIRGATRLRELRPRAGRSPWRALYRQVGGTFVIAAVGPEAETNPHGFTLACQVAIRRLAVIPEG